MSLDLKTLRRQARKVARTSLNLEDALARAAAKVVVMPEVGQLVARGLSGEKDRSDCPVLDHGPERTVHRGRAEPRDRST